MAFTAGFDVTVADPREELLIAERFPDAVSLVDDYEAADIKRLRQLEAENAKLKKLVAERDLEIETMKEINRRKW